MEAGITLSPLTINKICRVCLTESNDMLSIFIEIESDDKSQESLYIYNILMEISSMKILEDDNLPKLICVTCANLARSFLKFKQQCEQSQSLLDAYMSQSDSMWMDVQKKPESILPDLLNVEEVTLDNVSQGFKYSENCNETETLDSENKSSFLDDKSNDCILDGFKLDFGHRSDLVTENGLNKKSKKFNFEFYVKETANGEKVYACNLCDKIYKYGSSLKIHMRTHTLERPYKCTVCNKDFKQYGSLVYHKRSHTGEQPYSCKICGKRYKQSGTLTAHMRIHTGQRPFLCSVCGRGFRQAPDLGYHMRTHTKEKPYMCNVCGKTMSMQCHLVQHMRTHTGERPFKCMECNKAFPSTTRLKRHAIIHTGLKPYTCDVCEKSFNRSSSLRVHAKIHTDDRSHVCPVCGKGFIQAHALRCHVVTHSLEQYEVTVKL